MKNRSAIKGKSFSIIGGFFSKNCNRKILANRNAKNMSSTIHDENPAATFVGKLISRSDDFFGSLNAELPTSNRIRFILKENKVISEQDIWNDAKSTRVIAHSSVPKLLDSFLGIKRNFGSDKEKELYLEMTRSQLFHRLMVCRPLIFYTEQDVYLLNDKDKTYDAGGFENLHIDGQDASGKLKLSNLMSYEEMPLAALLSVSVPTRFINKGGRYNEGVLETMTDEYQPSGIFIGSVGARFEVPDRMEWTHMMITEEQNIPEKGYGPDADETLPQTKLLRMWADFYLRQMADDKSVAGGGGASTSASPYFMTYNQVCSMTAKELNERFVTIIDPYTSKKRFLDKIVYKKRMRAVIEPFLLDANARAEVAEKQAYVHAVGLGLGVWRVAPEQTDLMLEVYDEVFESVPLPHISDIDFSYFKDELGETTRPFDKIGNKVQWHFSRRDPAERLDDTNKILVAQYAWDSNSYPGNEYWFGSLAASGDPAAACCSTIGELQNPSIHPEAFESNRLVCWPRNKEYKLSQCLSSDDAGEEVKSDSLPLKDVQAQEKSYISADDDAVAAKERKHSKIADNFDDFKDDEKFSKLVDDVKDKKFSKLADDVKDDKKLSKLADDVKDVEKLSKLADDVKDVEKLSK
eukprot:gene11756-24654_t